MEHENGVEVHVLFTFPSSPALNSPLFSKFPPSGQIKTTLKTEAVTSPSHHLVFISSSTLFITS